MSKYYEQLKDPRWQRKRLEILQRADFMCESCGSTTETLHVHHGRYRKGTSPWEYEEQELHCLCAGCHLQAEEYRDHLMDIVSQAVDWIFWEDLLLFAEILHLGTSGTSQENRDRLEKLKRFVINRVTPDFGGPTTWFIEFLIDAYIQRRDQDRQANNQTR